jgi:hypothetical protein
LAVAWRRIQNVHSLSSGNALLAGNEQLQRSHQWIQAKIKADLHVLDQSIVVLVIVEAALMVLRSPRVAATRRMRGAGIDALGATRCACLSSWRRCRGAVAGRVAGVSVLMLQ